MPQVDACAAEIICEALRDTPAADRGQLLRAVLAHAAASLTVLEGERLAGEALYRLADAVVTAKRP